MRRRDNPWNPPARGADVSALFAVLVSVPLLLPLVASVAELAFALPALLLVAATYRCACAARRVAARRRVWLVFASGCALAGAASALALAAAIAGSVPTTAFYLGAVASAALLLGAALLARQGLRGARPEHLLDAYLVCAFIVSLNVWFVARPGFERGDTLLTAVFVVDLGALVLATLATIARRERRERRVGWGIVGICASAAAGDALVSMTAAGTAVAPVAIALLWAAAGVAAIVTADADIGAAGRPDEPIPEALGVRPVYRRVALPLLAMLALAGVQVALQLAGKLTTAAVLYFAASFAVMAVLAFARQARLLADNTQAVTRERGLSAQMMRRNADLEALTTLATTMSQRLEEEPIVERGLDALRLAARSTSAALHLENGGRLELRAASGAWASERAWVTPVAFSSSAEPAERGGRQIVGLPVTAHQVQLGVVTLVRAGAEPFDPEELALLELLAGQLALALRNARDYRTRLEEAIRDPLTGLHNRRFFYEMLGKEVERAQGSASPLSLVLFDVDDFKSINDSLGHASGDEALRALASFVEAQTRPNDTFARIGGEEFGLLLPATGQLEALLVAERIRRALAATDLLDGRRVTVSGGIASCPGDADSAELLEQKADAALYWSKQQGKNICAVAGEVVVRAGEERGCNPMVGHLHALVNAIDARLQTRDHSENVAAYAAAIGGALGFDSKRTVELHRAALLHDIGKLAVSEAILAKPGSLEPDEFEAIKLHPEVGAAMLRHAGLAHEARWVRHHHERMDGAGYPDGLAGRDVPLEARILFVADSFEAMTSDRPYRKGMDVADALDELIRCAGTQFDPDLVAILVQLVRDEQVAVLALREGQTSSVATHQYS